MLFQQGHYYMGGASVPFVVSNQKIRDGLSDRGFAEVQIFDRDVFPIAKLPSLAPGTSDDWDTIIAGRRIAPDGFLDVPSQVRWVADLTPPVVVAGTGPTPTQPGAAPAVPELPGVPSWMPSPEEAPTAPPVVPTAPSGIRKPIFVGLGVISGAVIGWWGVQHMFVEGLTDKERKNILVFSGVMLALWGGVNLMGLEKAWWMTPEGVAERAKTELEK